MKICWVCEEHENPFKGYEEYDASQENPENFTTVSWFGASKADDAHIECWQREK